MNPNEFNLFLELIADERVCEEGHTNPNEQMRKDLIYDSIMPGGLVYRQYLVMHCHLEVTLHALKVLGVDIIPGSRLKQYEKSFCDGTPVS